MKCLYCGDELVEGGVELYEMATLIPKLHPATIKFKPDDSNKNVKKSNTYVKDSHGCYCERCKRFFADFAAELRKIFIGNSIKAKKSDIS